MALDKSAAKVRQIVDNAARLGLHNVDAFAIDAVRAVDDAGSDALATPPFRPQSFDRILVDAPCSALGQRPQLYNPMRFQVPRRWWALAQVSSHFVAPWGLTSLFSL